MSLNPQQIFLYAAAPHDFEMAMGAAAAAGIPITQISGNFTTAWNTVAAGQYLVLAVGGAALYALYYNPCGWSNPAGTPAGHTPFAMASAPTTSLPGPNYFVSAGGYLAQDTYLAATLLAYYATHGTYPSGYQPMPKLLTPSQQCPNGAESNVVITC